MKKFRPLIAISAILVVSVALLSLAFIPKKNVRVQYDTVVTKAAAYDYYADLYKIENGDSFVTLSYTDLVNLLSDDTGTGGIATRPQNSPQKPNGYYVILFGGTDERTIAVARLLDGVAKESGLTVYVFDPDLDGGLAKELVGTISANGAADPANGGRTGYTYDGTDFLYDDLNISDYTYGGKTLLNRLNSAFTSGDTLAEAGEKIQTPLLVNVKRTQTPAPATVLRARLASPFIGKPAGYTLNKGDSASYTASARVIIGIDDTPASNADADAYYSAAETPRYDPFLTLADPTNPQSANNTHLTTNDVFVSVSYAGLVRLLNAPGQQLILLGGAGNVHTAAILPVLQKKVKAAFCAGADAVCAQKVYVFDPYIGGGTLGIQTADLASSATASGTHSVLYTSLVTTYFGGFVSRWNVLGSGAQSAVGLIGTNRDISVRGERFSRLADSALLLYDKAHGGVVDAIESELLYVYDTSLPNSGTEELLVGETNLNADRAAYKFIAQAFADLFKKQELLFVLDELKYGYEIDRTSARRTVLTAAREGSRLVLYTYFDPADAAQQKYDLEQVGISPVAYDGVSFYYIASDELKEIIASVGNASIYDTGITLNKPGYSNTSVGAASPSTGGGTSGGTGGTSGGSGTTTPPPSDDEEC
ncbi:MAG: hypothetical protein LBM78_03835 [Clostridiales bacterium]|jgi:hypothetical protein|nr:hypothetical protein [Clostridiales bacterium]